MNNQHTESSLMPFRVYLLEEGMDDLDETIFIAQAEDMEHAIEQARDAYPGCRVNWLSSHGANWFLAQGHAEHVSMDDDGMWGFIIRFDVPEASDDELELDDYSYRVEEWREGDIVDTYDAPSYQAAREWISREHSAHCQSRYSLNALCDHWNTLADTPVTDSGYLDQGFLFFPRGVHREEVWHWFESVNPDFKCGEAGGWIGDDHPYRAVKSEQSLADIKRETFIRESVADIPPVPCDFQKGDKVKVINAYGIEISGFKVLGFVREIDPDWRPKAIVYLDWGCYWFPVEVERLTLENQDVCSSCSSPAENIIGCPDGAELCSQCFDNSNH